MKFVVVVWKKNSIQMNILTSNNIANILSLSLSLNTLFLNII